MEEQKEEKTRRSLCTVCGKRLSERTESGEIHWQPGHVDDSGIYCETCHATVKPAKGKKGKKS